MLTYIPDTNLSQQDKSQIIKLVDLATINLFKQILQNFKEAETKIEDCFAVYQDFRGDDKLLYRPEYFDWHYKLKKISNDASKIYPHLERLRNIKNIINDSQKVASFLDQAYGFEIDVTSYRDDPETLLSIRAHEMIEQVMSGKNEQERSRSDSSLKNIEKLTGEQLEKIFNAFQIIKDVWPEILEEILFFVKKYIFFDCRGTVGFADIFSQGLIANQIYKIDNPIHLAELIIHESSHTRLNAALIHRKIYLNGPEEKFSSPLRKDKRPMYGLIHQLYVLVRLNEYYNKLLIAGYDVKEIKLSISKQYQHARSVVIESARLTDEGKTFIDTMPLIEE